MNTVILRDINLSEGIVYQTEESIEDVAEYWHERSGLWTPAPDGGGALLLSEAWCIDYFENQVFYSLEDAAEYGGMPRRAEDDEDGNLVIED